MAEQQQQTDLRSLSQAWSERVKGIRQMAKKGETGVLTADLPEPSSLAAAAAISADSELFTEPVHEDFSVQDVFVGNEDFYKSMDAPSGSSDFVLPAEIAASPKVVHKGYSLTSKVLLGGVILTLLAVLLYGVFLNVSFLHFVSLLPEADSQSGDALKPAPENGLQNDNSELLLSPDQPVSLTIAQDYYLEAKYAEAYAVYKRLFESLPEADDNDALKDFLRLNMALCMGQSRREALSVDLLKQLSLSGSPTVRILANYHLSLFEMEQKQFLAARTRACRAIGFLDTIDFNAEWSQELRRNCYFLAAEAVSREALSLADADRELPTKLWPEFDVENAPLAGLTEEELHRALNTGSQQLNKALLGPKIQKETKGNVPYWAASCNGASIGELMGRFSSNSGYDVRWQTGPDKTSLRDRSVSLYLTGVNEQQFMTITAGSAGLLAYFDEQNAIMICNPGEYASVSEQMSLLSAEAVSCWQNYLLAFLNDPYSANAHFALGLLKEQQGLVAESLAEYKMVSGRYSRSALRSGAFVCSSKLKAKLHDYPGAYDDLKEVVEQDPDYEEIDQTYLALADMAGKIGRDDEAAKLYCKVYYLNNSEQSQSAAALAAGKIFYNNHNFVDAEKWLTEYVDLVEDDEDENFCQGCLLLGKTWLALGNFKSACDALRVALSGSLSQQDHVETVVSLVKGYMYQERFVEALQILNDTSLRQFSQAESVQMVFLKSQALRGMGLVDKAIMLLNERREYVLDELLKGEIGYELSACYIEQGQLELARKELVSILEEADSGPLAQKTALKLAEVCLELGFDTQVLSVGSQLLSSHPQEAIEQKMLELLATVYRKQKNYDRAALVLMGQWE